MYGDGILTMLIGVIISQYVSVPNQYAVYLSTMSQLEKEGI